MKIVLNLNARLQPYIRHDFEDMLDVALAESGYGKTTGGGTYQDENGEISGCDITMDISDEVPLEKIKEFLEIFELPKGSNIAVNGKNIELGILEGIGIYLDGINLPDNVYIENDVEELIDILAEKLEDELKILSYWQGNEKTAIYFYGQSHDAMYKLIKDILSTHPLCQNHEVKKIA